LNACCNWTLTINFLNPSNFFFFDGETGFIFDNKNVENSWHFVK